MKCFCYFHDPSSPAFPHMLVKLWRESWTRNGFDCQVLTEADARRHPDFDRLDAYVAKLPTVCGRQYERACWLRWLAFELSSPAVFCDYDVINFGWKPSDVPVERGEFTPLHGDSNGASTACVYADLHGVRWFVEQFYLAHENVITWQGKPHIGDMTLLWQLHPGFERYPCLHANHPMALQASLVHFQNDTVPEHWKGNLRYRAVLSFRRRRAWKHFTEVYSV